MIDEKYIAALCASMVMSTQLSYGTYRNISKTLTLFQKTEN